MSTAVASALGFARFAYALILPAMKISLHWTYFEAGSLNIANAVGYMIGAIATAPFARRYGTKVSFLASLTLISIFTLIPALTTQLSILLIDRAASGIFGAVALITGGALIAHANMRSPRRVATAALGIYFGGAGLGIVASGAVLPLILSRLGNSGWRLGWLVLTSFCVFALIANYYRTRSLTEPTKPSGTDENVPMKHFRPSFIAYGMFGAGYISFMTFVVAFLQQRGATQGFITLFYVVLGLSAMVSGFFWDRALGVLRQGYGLAATLFLVALGMIIPIISQNRLLVLLAAFSFGIAVMATTTAIMRIAQRNALPSSVTPILGRATFYVAAGQSLGPLVTGLLSDTATGLKLGMKVAAMVCVLAIGASLIQRDNTYTTIINSDRTSTSS